MSSILLKEFKNPSNSSLKGHTYKDISLDLQQADLFVSNSGPIKSVKGKDLRDSLDEAAINNSVRNILSTRQGQRFLVPRFGCNLLGFIGEPITDYTGQKIGQVVLDALRLWEPRVTVDQVIVTGNVDRHEYDIKIFVTIPSLKKTDVLIVSTLTSNGILER